jgi:Flp pilus assembly secretin CpaC
MSSWSLSRGLKLFAYALVSLCLPPALVAAQEPEKPIIVDMDYARIVKMPEGAQTLVIGNPMVADVTMLKNNQLLVITGKSFGTTNLIVLDRTGAQVGESIIRVVSANDTLTVQRGPHRESYACNPDCLPTVNLKDSTAFQAETIANMKLHDGSAAAAKR